MAESFNLQKAREICESYTDEPDESVGGDPCRFRKQMVDLLPAACDEIERLQKAISEPLDAFGTPELIAWSQELTRLLDVPESERGGWPFVLSVGCHLEKFAKSWNSQTMAEKDAEIERLRAENSRLDADILSTCVNRQAAEIEELKTKIDDDAIIANHKYLDLQYICTDQDKRIEKLEAALVEERARGDYFENSQESDGYWWDRKNTEDVTQNDYREMAKGRLRAEGEL